MCCTATSHTRCKTKHHNANLQEVVQEMLKVTSNFSFSDVEKFPYISCTATSSNGEALK